MAESTRLVDLVQLGIDEFISDRTRELSAITEELLPFVNAAGGLLSGGKKFRALFCYWGWQATNALPDDFDPLPDNDDDGLPAIVLAASALEIFHAAALVHDDIMDKSDIRRGAPSVHKSFENMHVREGFAKDPAEFGQSAALLLGDLLLGWSDELFDSAGALLPSSSFARAGRREFTRMRTEVTAGQYLDILEENSWMRHPEIDALPRAHRVIIYKSAKYSVEAPLVIGAALGGANDEQLAALRLFGLPLGVAYQLRDDVLGVFGDPLLTGKPAGDDLREGKRTVLIACARSRLPTPARKLIDELLGDPSLEQEQIEMIRTAIVECGAVDEVEKIIEYNVDRATAAIRNAPLALSARNQLLDLADTVTQRAS